MRVCIRCDTKFDERKRQCPRCKFWHCASNALALPQVVESLAGDDEDDVQRIAIDPAWDFIFGPAGQCEECKGEEVMPCLHKEPNGIAVTAVVLIGGSAGAGKTTLMLQLSRCVCEALPGRFVLYLCSEQSVKEVRAMAKRLGMSKAQRAQILGLSTLTGSEALLQLEAILEKHNPAALVVDSLSTLCGDDDAAMIAFAKLAKSLAVRRNMPVLCINHVTKTDDFAGLYELQHHVDETITFYPADLPPEHDLPDARVLEVKKNRFGRAFVTCLLNMTETGLVPIALNETDAEASNG